MDPAKDSDVKVEVKDTRPGCWGLAYVEWLRVTAIFLVMWTLLGLFMWALIQIGLTVRGTQYLLMEQRFVGKFDRPLIPVLRTEATPNPITGEPTVTTLNNTFNRAAGCYANPDVPDGILCPVSGNPSWGLGDWIKNTAWTGIYTSCAQVDTTGTDENIARATRLNGKLGTSNDAGIATYCLNVLPTWKFGTAGTPQDYPIAGLAQLLTS